MDLELGDDSVTVLRGRMVLERGLNRGELPLPGEIGTLATLVARSFYRYRPEGQTDQWKPIAVLSELHASSACSGSDGLR